MKWLLRLSWSVEQESKRYKLWLPALNLCSTGSLIGLERKIPSTGCPGLYAGLKLKTLRLSPSSTIIWAQETKEIFTGQKLIHKLLQETSPCNVKNRPGQSRLQGSLFLCLEVISQDHYVIFQEAFNLFLTVKPMKEKKRIEMKGL